MGWRNRTSTSEELIHIMRTTNNAVERETARATVITQNMPLVVSVARKFYGQHMTFEDLVQEGTLGLIHAVARFDPSLGYRFSTYATIWARQAIGRALNKDMMIGIPEHRIGQRDQLPRVVYSLDAPLAGSDTSPLADFISDADLDPEELALQHVLSEELALALAALPEQQRRVIELKFGLRDGQARTLSELVPLLGISRTRCGHLLTAAIKTLRQQASVELESRA